jgi:hypothetical protein
MSHQPSAADNARSTTSDAVHKVADILDPSEESSKLGPKGREVTQDIQGTKIVKGSYKDQLNQAAYDGRKALQIEESLVEKGILVSNMLTRWPCLVVADIVSRILYTRLHKTAQRNFQTYSE